MTEKLATRAEVPDELKWNLKDLYPSDEAFEQAAAAFKEKLKSFGKHEGHVTDSASNLYETFKELTLLINDALRLEVYGQSRNDSDTTNPDGTRLFAEAQSTLITLESSVSFMDSEVSQLSDSRFAAFMCEEPGLKNFQRDIEVNYLRSRGHILPAEQEKILAQTGDMFANGENVFSVLTDADMTLGEIKTNTGKKVELSWATKSIYSESSDRYLRKQADENIRQAYKKLQHTLAATLTAHMKGTVINNRLHHFETAREGELFRNEIPESVYETLVSAVHDHLEGEHQYLRLRKDCLGLKPMYEYDNQVPLAGNPKIKFTYSDSKKIVLEALAVLGDDYLDGLKKEFNEGWIDAAENVGKRAGGYQVDVYGVHPYILLNWSDNYEGLTTLAHESGHAMQSYFSDKNQPSQYTHYLIFTAEIASTTNENLLLSFMLDKYADNKDMKIYLLQKSIHNFIDSVNKQTLYAEFEHDCYQTIESGHPLIAEELSKDYASLRAQYSGPAESATSSEDIHWAWVPHFYYNYYVYQYATSMAISTILADRIYRKVPGALEQYKAFLKAGSSQAPIDLIKQVGVDVTSGQYLDDAFAVLDKRIAELKELLGK
ncbi:oligoendopeptidase F [Furfurilactobacillus rossiae]|uniref:Oligopeptidase F n=1 Tax=Furfurilactobacillus rossiae DSM 15814 TaxID=1114972 RepID=A0A0R1RJR5_9LACO|nr:oligoendopeptidase F [Furfurilactobacillus rossiae]KRL53939.1 oligoendopeptidase F [Furfurilactobacillus rossiae DSM 15814]QFR66644.1 oligoendopeptidase F [Furfurilactobacillus rossiae]QLE62118.1 oligoendopeptidase F [Furfurilactobacillus rossiae]